MCLCVCSAQSFYVDKLIHVTCFSFRHVRVFYVEVTDKLIKKFPFKDETLKTLSFVDPEKRDNVQAEDGNYVFVFMRVWMGYND